MSIDRFLQRAGRGLRMAMVAVLGLGAGGCPSLDVFRVHDDSEGLESLYRLGDTLSVLIVHGMGEHPPGYSGAMQKKIALGTGMNPAGTVLERRRLNANGYHLAVVTKTSYEQVGGGKKRLTVIELSWSEATTPIKTLLLDLDPANDYEERGFLEANRLWLNSKGKQFVNTHFSDPILYVGSFGAVLRDLVSQAICIMFSPPGRPAAEGARCSFQQATAPAGELAIITASLGSALVFDTAVELFSGGQAERLAAQRLIAGTKRIYMFANQLPLIELRELDAITGPDWLENYPCPTRAPDEAAGGRRPSGLRGFLTLRRGLGAAEEALDPRLAGLNVVAFNDPNDLLTYGLTDRFKKRCGPANFANVTVTNAATRWLFIVADPLEAHTGYEANDRVMDLVIKGHSSSSAARH